MVGGGFTCGPPKEIYQHFYFAFKVTTT